MHIHSRIAALRNDPVSQRQLQVAVDAAHSEWREHPPVAAILHDLEAYGEGKALGELERLSPLVSDHSIALTWVEGWTAHFTRCLAANPLALMPMRQNRSESFSSLQLATCAGAAISLAVYEPRESPLKPRSALFTDVEQHEIVLAGAAEGVVHRIHSEARQGAELNSEFHEWSSGSRILLSGANETRQVLEVEQTLLVLQLIRAPERPGLTREYALGTGKLLMQSSGGKRVSQQEMAMAVLSAMDRSDAAPAIADLGRSGPEHRRWEAVRHTLALDTLEGMRLLEKIAQDRDDPLLRQALELESQLKSAYPQLANDIRAEQQPCPM
jgi:hypothetical protein